MHNWWTHHMLAQKPCKDCKSTNFVSQNSCMCTCPWPCPGVSRRTSLSSCTFRRRSSFGFIHSGTSALMCVCIYIYIHIYKRERERSTGFIQLWHNHHEILATTVALKMVTFSYVPDVWQIKPFPGVCMHDISLLSSKISLTCKNVA